MEFLNTLLMMLICVTLCALSVFAIVFAGFLMSKIENYIIWRRLKNACKRTK